MVLAVLTPSFRGDFPLCSDLVASVKKYFPPGTQHYVVVPREDLRVFSGLGVEVVDEEQFLPRAFVRAPGTRYSINLASPFPPVRGWVRQQLIKLAVAEQVKVDTLIVVDSDIVFMRDVSESQFNRQSVRLFRSPAVIGPGLPRHMMWHRNARRLLGLLPADEPYDDYVSSLISWDPSYVRALKAHMEQGRLAGWLTQAGRCLHFSEWTLYGLFVFEVLNQREFVSADSLCHAHWGVDPLSLDSGRKFMRSIGENDVAVMISAKSGTELAVRRALYAHLPDTR